MSEQAKILDELYKIIMNILQNGTASPEEADKIDELEDLLHQQKCFKDIEHEKHSLLGEEIATLFFNDKYAEAIDKLQEFEITPDDFFGFVEYHYADDHEDEDLVDMFTSEFVASVSKDYESKSNSN